MRRIIGLLRRCPDLSSTLFLFFSLQFASLFFSALSRTFFDISLEPLEVCREMHEEAKQALLKMHKIVVLTKHFIARAWCQRRKTSHHPSPASTPSKPVYPFEKISSNPLFARAVPGFHRSVKSQ
jgi:hypothetical protein